MDAHKRNRSKTNMANTIVFACTHARTSRSWLFKLGTLLAVRAHMRAQCVRRACAQKWKTQSSHRMDHSPIEQDFWSLNLSGHTKNLVPLLGRPHFALHHKQPVLARLSRTHSISGPASDQALCMNCLQTQPASNPQPSRTIVQFKKLHLKVSLRAQRLALRASLVPLLSQSN